MAGAELKLPIWLAEPLTRKKVAIPSMPKTHAKAIRQELRVDAVSVSLAQNQYIFELGSVLALLTGDVELPPLLSATFTARFAQLWDSARNWREEDTSRATTNMCASEKKRAFSCLLRFLSVFFPFDTFLDSNADSSPPLYLFLGSHDGLRSSVQPRIRIYLQLLRLGASQIARHCRRSYCPIRLQE